MALKVSFQPKRGISLHSTYSNRTAIIGHRGHPVSSIREGLGYDESMGFACEDAFLITGQTRVPGSVCTASESWCPVVVRPSSGPGSQSGRLLLAVKVTSGVRQRLSNHAAVAVHEVSDFVVEIPCGAMSKGYGPRCRSSNNSRRVGPSTKWTCPCHEAGSFFGSRTCTCPRRWIKRTVACY